MLDDIDREIISYLQYDGRTPYTQIAEELKITETTVRRRVKQLIDAGIMQIVAIVEPHELGWTEAAMIGVQVQLDQLDSVVERIRELPEASYLFQAAGDYDLFVEVFCKDRDHFVSFLNDTLVKIPGIVRTQSFLILKMHKISYRWGEANSPRVNHTMQASQDPVLDKEK